MRCAPFRQLHGFPDEQTLERRSGAVLWLLANAPTTPPCPSRGLPPHHAGSRSCRCDGSVPCAPHVSWLRPPQPRGGLRPRRGGSVLHFELYYRMARPWRTGTTNGKAANIAWPRRGVQDVARQHPSSVIPSYRCYTRCSFTRATRHAELEMIGAAVQQLGHGGHGLSPRDARRVLAWISVHIGGTEKAHFAHSPRLRSLSHSCAGSGARIDLDLATTVSHVPAQKARS